MAYSKLESNILEMATPIAEECGCYIYDIEYAKEGKARYLRIYADKDGGISLDDCEAISRRMSDELDKADPIKENYVLEVSSPGIERKLKNPEHFERYLGEVVEIGLFKAVNDSKTILAELKGFEDGKISVSLDGEEMSIMQSETTYVKLHFEF
ncbi:MAG: ribosome maturation factor RimP [Ruminococcaceae bacterium]|nr:ribosome maturation factor RimP [Oscillospiraceae bacterium]